MAFSLDDYNALKTRVQQGLTSFENAMDSMFGHVLSAQATVQSAEAANPVGDIVASLSTATTGQLSTAQSSLSTTLSTALADVNAPNAEATNLLPNVAAIESEVAAIQAELKADEAKAIPPLPSKLT